MLATNILTIRDSHGIFGQDHLTDEELLKVPQDTFSTAHTNRFQFRAQANCFLDDSALDTLSPQARQEEESRDLREKRHTIIRELGEMNAAENIKKFIENMPESSTPNVACRSKQSNRPESPPPPPRHLSVATPSKASHASPGPVHKEAEQPGLRKSFTNAVGQVENTVYNAAVATKDAVVGAAVYAKDKAGDAVEVTLGKETRHAGGHALRAAGNLVTGHLADAAKEAGGAIQSTGKAVSNSYIGQAFSGAASAVTGTVSGIASSAKSTISSAASGAYSWVIG